MGTTKSKLGLYLASEGLRPEDTDFGFVFKYENLTFFVFWDDEDDQDGHRPDSVFMKLLANNEETGVVVELPAKADAEPEDGTIRTAGPLDREARVWHNLTVLATELGEESWASRRAGRRRTTGCRRCSWACRWRRPRRRGGGWTRSTRCTRRRRSTMRS